MKGRYIGLIIGAVIGSIVTIGLVGFLALPIFLSQLVSWILLLPLFDKIMTAIGTAYNSDLAEGLGFLLSIPYGAIIGAIEGFIIGLITERIKGAKK